MDRGRRGGHLDHLDPATRDRELAHLVRAFRTLDFQEMVPGAQRDPLAQDFAFDNLAIDTNHGIGVIEDDPQGSLAGRDIDRDRQNQSCRGCRDDPPPQRTRPGRWDTFWPGASPGHHRLARWDITASAKWCFMAIYASFSRCAGALSPCCAAAAGVTVVTRAGHV